MSHSLQKCLFLFPFEEQALENLRFFAFTQIFNRFSKNQLSTSVKEYKTQMD
jgi:hypothetical protein